MAPMRRCKDLAVNSIPLTQVFNGIRQCEVIAQQTKLDVAAKQTAKAMQACANAPAVTSNLVSIGLSPIASLVEHPIRCSTPKRGIQAVDSDDMDSDFRLIAHEKRLYKKGVVEKLALDAQIAELTAQSLLLDSENKARYLRIQEMLKKQMEDLDI